jgi:RimJ/RimL family protein N-acetyltransferase
VQIYELPSPQFYRAARVFDDIWFDRAQIDAVFAGTQPGRIFVDDVVDPSSALICRTYGFYVAGDAGSIPLRRFMHESPSEATVFSTLYGYMLTAEWTRSLLLDHEKDLEIIERRMLSLPLGIRPRPRNLPSGAIVREIDLTLAERIDDELDQFIAQSWGSCQAFVSGGFGYCTLLGDDIASVAYTIAVSDEEANIDVETAKPYRRQGFSALTSTAYIDRCMQEGLVPTWDCDAINASSMAVALSLGFRPQSPFWQLSPARGITRTYSEGGWVPHVLDDGVVTFTRAD